jgi:hypothetical protein
MLTDQLDQRQAIARFGHDLYALSLNQRAYALSHDLMIVGENHPERHFVHLPHRTCFGQSWQGGKLLRGA